MVALPVTDQWSRQLVEPAEHGRIGAGGTGMKTQLHSSSFESEKGGATGARAHQLARPAKRQLAAMGAGHRGKASGAAILLIELMHAVQLLSLLLRLPAPNALEWG